MTRTILASRSAVLLTAMAAQAGCPKAHPLAQQITRLRVLQGITRRELAERAGIPERTVSQWLDGTTKTIPLTGIEACFNVLGFRLGPVEVPILTDEETAAYLRGMGWTVTPPQQDARAATQKPVGGV